MDILDLLNYAFFRNALLGSLFASIACGIIGTYVVLRRLVFISGGITHASFGGLGVLLRLRLICRFCFYLSELYILQKCCQ